MYVNVSFMQWSSAKLLNFRPVLKLPVLVEYVSKANLHQAKRVDKSCLGELVQTSEVSHYPVDSSELSTLLEQPEQWHKMPTHKVKRPM